MKKYRLIYMMAAVVCLTTACREDYIGNGGKVTLPAEVGEEVLFGARAGFENANPSATRTAYNGSYTVGTTSYERIIWTDKDKIQIYSPEATNPSEGLAGNDVHSAHYAVKRQDDTNTDNRDEAYLERTEESSLQWGQGADEAGTHTFYAMYPSLTMFMSDEGNLSIPIERAEAIGMTPGDINGYIHTEQMTTVTKDGDHYTASPDMRYAYMVAKTTTTREAAYEVVDEATGKVKGVNLTFFPIVTAMEIELTLPKPTTEATVNPVTIANVIVSGTDIAGSFSAAIDGADSWVTDASGATTGFTGAIASGDFKESTITIQTTYGENQAPLQLQPGESLTFTVFMKPTADFDNLKVGITTDLVGMNKKFQKLGSDNSPVTVVARKKNVFTGLKLPINLTEVGIEYGDWMQQLPANTPIFGISLPGTGNSFSAGLASDAANREYYVAQNLTFEEQWEAGIRAFEIVTDRQNNTSGSNFSSLTVQCGKSDVYETDATTGAVTTDKLSVTVAVNKILQKLRENRYETAMLIFTYQPEGSSPARHGPAYMKQLVNYVNTLDPNELVMYEPTLLLGDYEKEDDGSIKEGAVSKDATGKLGARGKLMIVVRPNQKNEKDYASLDANGTSANDSINWEGIKAQITGNAAEKILAVNGCGTAKDKWGARGYKINGDKAPDISNSASTYIENYMQTEGSPIFTAYGTEDATYTWTNGTVTITRAPKDDAESLGFGYKTNNTSVTCWFQEWGRVLEKDIYSEGTVTTAWLIQNIIPLTRVSYKTQWFESYEEKLSNVKTTFDMAVSGNYVEQGYVFINSLCGYLTSGTPDVSVQPSIETLYGGDYGNISALSTKLNQEFYEYVNTKRKEMVAPTGIVLMDFVSNDATNGGGAYLLPQIIIANNEFKAGVDTGDDDEENKEPDPDETPEGGDQGGIEG